jgi:hypothetical protein
MFLAALASTLLLGPIVRGQDHPARKEIEAIYAKRDKAIRDRDFAYLKTHLAKDYTEKSTDGTVLDRKQADAEADQIYAMVKEVHEHSTKVDSIKNGEEKGVLIVEVSDRGKVSFMDPNGKLHELFGRGRSRDVWKFSRQGWQIRYHEELESYVEVDGKPIK